jgi:hypothetical protein
LSVKKAGSPAIACFSEAQSPKSINLQRSQQKGLKGNSFVHKSFFEHEGQEIDVVISLELADA